MTEDAPESLPRRIWKKLTSGKFLYVSILVHVLFALIAVVFVVQVISPKRKLVFIPTPPVKEPQQHEVQMAKKQKSMSAPAPAKRITTTGLSKIALPEMPPMPSTAPSEMASMTGMGGPGLGLGSGGGMGGGSGGGGGIPFFGLRTGDGFEGTFYDLKQNRGRRPTGMTPEKYTKEVYQFTSGSWNEGTFAQYFKAPEPLYTRQIFVPSMPAAEGPKAFSLEKLVQPKMWVAVYKATVIPPYSGNIRFVGKGDDIMIVRFNNRVVLDWSQPDAGRLSNWRAHNKAYMFPNTNTYGIMPGDWISVQAGQSYPMEVLIGERPGGGFMAYLYIEKAGGKYDKDAHGTPILPVFRLAGGADFQLPNGAKAPPVAPNNEPWKSVKGAKDLSSPLGQGLLP
jgi:hypothetical protein